MRCLAILLFSLWAEGCFAGTCVPNNTVNIAQLVNEYLNGVSCIPTPIIESGDEMAGDFRDTLTRAIETYGSNLVNNLICQAVDVGDRYVNCIEKTSHRLQETIKSLIPNKGKSIDLNAKLEQLINQLNKVLDLKPGNVVIKHSALPQLPEQQIDVQSRTTKRTPKELFLEFDGILNNVATNVFGYITEQYLEGWRIARPQYFVIFSQIREKVLNDKVLAASRVAVDEVYECKDLVRSNVLPETWKSFEDTARRIIELSSNYNASKNGEQSCSLCTDCTYG